MSTNLDAEKEALAQRAMQSLDVNRPVWIETDLATAISLIGQLQLAFRHPQNTGPSRQSAEAFVRQLIESIDSAHGDVFQFLNMGFDPRFDA